ncbi:hypothetical protein TRV_03761 [Trichophyton verrucosum HKI 0517]|uniref:Uncharacterized protein n=1 Tax=Trichophyton verrucosum (strain HKI 0517) TaxID=663202 RepID=D4D9G8_TRIVH|nr:uncharacterized protein TRV_03761 [Trichophyton verrucosum HKI 0517]EFE41498.1 hypothetical protein TRV_03761 [Trichophyton verrucosum HKI 0517]
MGQVPSAPRAPLVLTSNKGAVSGGTEEKTEETEETEAGEKKKKGKKKKEKKPNCYRPGGQQHLGLKGQGSLVHLASSIRQKQTSTASAGGSKKDREARRESFFFSLLSTSCSSFSFSSSLSSPPHLGF